MTAPLHRIARPLLRLDFAKSHRIYKNAAGQKVPGVTAVLGILDKPGLRFWAWNEGKAGREMTRTKQDAADIGTVAHGLVQAHLLGMELDGGNIPPETLTVARGGFEKWLKWWQTLGVKEVVAVERELVSEKLQVGGTLDFGARCEDGTLVLGDGKSSKAIYWENEAQAAAYAAMYEEETGEHADRVYVVRFGKNAEEPIETREVVEREKKVRAFAALAVARRDAMAAGWKP